MSLRPEVSIPVALATAAVVLVVYDHALPTVTDSRVGGMNDDHLASAEKQAALTSIGIVGAISLISRDVNVFIVGGLMTVALSWWHRHANMVNPETGKATAPAAVRTPDMYSGSAAGMG
jgi:hypothetical protein